MDKKIIFIDVDGTLCGANGSVPNSAKSAIQMARQNGHEVLLCTGRSLPEITPDIYSIGFDGLIGAGGGYIEYNGNVILHKVMDAQAVISITEYFQQNDIGYYLESNDGIFASENCIDVIYNVITKGLPVGSARYHEKLQEMQWFIDILKIQDVGKYDIHNINKISFINDKIPFEELQSQWSDTFYLHRSTVVQFGKDSGEIAMKNSNKKTAIELLLNEINISKEHTMAYGDSHNDFEMFKAVHHSVAMGNATQKLKEIATEITNIPEENGIYNSFLLNNLIGPLPILADSSCSFSSCPSN